MSNVTAGDRTEELIKNALQWGKRQQVELVEITDRATSTVRNKLEYLVDKGEIERIEESGKVYYKLADGPTEPIEPKPSANDGKIRVLLDTIASGMGVDTEIGQSEYEMELSDIRSEIYPGAPDDVIAATHDFKTECSQKYKILSDDDNLKKCMAILDELIAMYGKKDQNAESNGIFENAESNGIFGRYSGIFNDDKNMPRVLLLPEGVYNWYFTSYLAILKNWKVGKENKDFFPEISQRTDAIVQNSPRMPDGFGLALQHVVLSVDDEQGREMFNRMVQHGDYNVETLREAAIRTYETENNMKDLFRTLENIEVQVTGEREEKIQRLRDDIRDIYQ